MQAKEFDAEPIECAANTEVGTTELTVYNETTRLDVSVKGKVFDLEQPLAFHSCFGIDSGDRLC